MYNLSIFIFTRDLRLNDNTALIEALKQSKQVIPIFILNPEQLSNSNKYKSNNCIQFMCECLEDLNDELLKHGSKLFLFYGKPTIILKNMLKENDKIDAIFMTKDYTPFSKEREKNIKNISDDIDYIFLEDYILTNSTDSVKNLNNNTYVKFTPFYRKAQSIKIREVTKNLRKNYLSKHHNFSNQFDGKLSKFYKENDNIWIKGGRKNGLKQLDNVVNLKQYNKTRDIPSELTTNLSAYLKFNVVSVREVYWKFYKTLGSKTKLIAQLYWRDFYMSIMDHYDVINKNMNSYKIKWDGKMSDFEKWKNGKTGYPLVDAGMRQLNETGYMHNRLRMVVGSFLVKILHIDWKKGEKYFSTKLVDYDQSNNNGGWQWVAGTGTDSQPYFRYLNPWIQSAKFDKDAIYIKKYVHELKDIEPKIIHKWFDKYEEFKDIEYPKPLYDNVTERVKDAIKMYKK
jgi:deoxyribodipyrimidine photo-lyase